MLAKLVVTAFLILLCTSISESFAQGEDTTEQKLLPPRNIPGITTQDQFPKACVDCHINYTEMNMDTRFSTLMQLWRVRVDSALLAKAQNAAPEGMILKGVHPDAPTTFNNIPAECLTCHSKKSNVAPPFARMIHKIHLTGGTENHFLTLFQGECTYCHKLDMKTGSWTIPSAPEH